MAFSILSPTDAEPVTEQLAKMSIGMKKVRKQNVYYDIGQVAADGGSAAGMDLRTYCLDGKLYSMVFLFRAGKQTVLENFHCSFSMYDIWKLLATVQE